jgi:Heavy metal binding domain
VLKTLYLLLYVAFLSGQSTTIPESLDYVCPMDPEIRSSTPGTCWRCGMKLTVGVADPVEYGLNLRLQPQTVRVNQMVELTFSVTAPNTSNPVRCFEIVHERPFHLFIFSEDLNYFAHEHPEAAPDDSFRFKTRFPKPGMYRLLCDFFPRGGTPQLLARTLFVSASRGMPVPLETVRLNPDVSAKHALNVDVDLVTDPAVPIAGMKTQMLFRLRPAQGIEPYLGAWGHMLIVSEDLVDAMHHHPFLADGGPRIQFNVIFPRAQTYRVWVQFQRERIVNTVAFNVRVSSLASRK